MKRYFVLLLAIVIPNLCVAEVTKLASADRSSLLIASKFHDIHSTADLPPSIIALCADSKGRLANPGQNWQVTDVILDESLPSKRLIWAAASSEYYVVHYERGGFAHSFHILIAKVSKRKKEPIVIWRGVSFDLLKNYQSFLDAIKSGKLDDRLPYTH